ncbi:MAG: CDP-alcohol phosphatidyltransferase family protein [Alphaproteobacteria bacterium]
MNFHGLLQLLPNLISLARLLAVPVAIYLILQDELFLAFWVFVAAGISDAIDGLLAKRFNLVTEIGSYLDPLADKALLVGVYVTLGYVGQVPIWLVILIVFRDVLIVGGAILFQTITHSLRMEPLFISKVNTAAQITLAAVILAKPALGVTLDAVPETLIVIVAMTTFLSGAAYVIKWGRMALIMERDE